MRVRVPICDLIAASFVCRGRRRRAAVDRRPAGHAVDVALVGFGALPCGAAPRAHRIILVTCASSGRAGLPAQAVAHTHRFEAGWAIKVQHAKTCNTQRPCGLSDLKCDLKRGAVTSDIPLLCAQ